MIEIEIAKSGDRILRWDGRLLASRVDPRKEAKDWLARRRTFINRVRRVFVLGLGSGYHVRELAETTSAEIIVVEYHHPIIKAVSPDLSAFPVTTINVERACELRGHALVREAVRESFVVLDHPASVSLNPGFYKECRAILVGRDWINLTWQWKLKGFPSLDSEPRVQTGEDPLTIHDLDGTELVKDSTERERLLLKALRELVK